jgi:hypothetical protein
MRPEERRTTAIVTGSGRGIIEETAVLLTKKGVNVVVCSRTDSDCYGSVSMLAVIQSISYLYYIPPNCTNCHNHSFSKYYL